MIKDFNYYMSLNWTYLLEWDDVDNCYIATVAELKGCMADGETCEEALKNIKDALASYIDASFEYNDSIPEPLKPVDFKGKIPYRTTPEKHYKIAKKAKQKGTSINKLLDEAVSNYLEKN